MSDRLHELQIDIASVPSRPSEFNSPALRQLAERVTSLMIDEMLDWRVVFQHRPLVR
jgi:hypothetical protein